MRKITMTTLTALLLAMPFKAAPVNYFDRIIQHEGIEARVKIESTDSNSPPTPIAGQFVQFSIDAKRLADEQPLDAWPVGAWLDLEISPLSGAVPVCGQRIAGFLSGNLMRQPLLDLTGYFVLTLDEEGSVSVLDPSVNFANKSSLYSVIKLGGTGFDWVKTSDDSRLFVAIPDSREVAVIDLQKLKLIQRIKLTGQPTRLALMPGERLLWVGQTGEEDAASQLTVIDTLNGQTVASLPLPKGHHEFAFSEQEKQVFVSNRDDGSIVMIDVINIKPLKTWLIPGMPLSLALTQQSRLLWVADAKWGRILRYTMQGEPLDTIALKPGIGPIRLSPDQDFLFVLNPSEHSVYILDTKDGRLVQTLTISGRPYDVMFSKQYAYIRTLDTEQAALISLNELKKHQDIAPKYIPVGANKMSLSPILPIASSMTPSLNLSGAFFAAPSEGTVYHYMEGMNAPNSGIRTYGHIPLATLVVQSGLRQTGPGHYSALIRLPSAGRLVLALASEAPQFKECISVVVKPEDKPINEDGIKMEWVGKSFISKKPGEEIELRVHSVAKAGVQAHPVNTIGVRIVPTSGGKTAYWPLTIDLANKGDFIATGALSEPGSYYLHIVSDTSVTANFATLVIENP
jgi:DNA-binding beta-propeller fold protein YncE